MNHLVIENRLSHKIIGAAIEVHKILGGPGLLESIYESALCHELNIRRMEIKRQVLIPVKYKDTIVKEPLCLDILVDEKVIVEVKATEKEHTIHQAQLLTYLKITGLKLGLLNNFGQNCVKDGIYRVINTRQTFDLT